MISKSMKNQEKSKYTKNLILKYEAQFQYNHHSDIKTQFRIFMK